MSVDPTFQRDALVDKPGIVGARWWHASLADEQSKIARRQAIKGLLIAGGVIAGFGAIIAIGVKAAASSTSAGSTPAGTSEGRKTTLAMQQDYGWSFGANDESLVFDGETTKPFDPNAFTDLSTTMMPVQNKLVRFWQPTLFQSPYASPAKSAEMDPDDLASFKKLAEVLKPISTQSMDAAYAAGQLMGTLAKAAKDGTALIVDLPGPEAVAFAAGASDAFDRVFLFDNWPHPRGVVKAHETLSAALYFQPLFARRRIEQAGAASLPPMFILDRRRLAPYADEASQFDNRYVAKLPWPATALTSIGISDIAYVVPTDADATSELDDINDDFVGYAAGKIALHGVALTNIVEKAKWPLGRLMSPSPRKTTYSTGAGSPAPLTSRPRPSTFGTVAVVVAVGTGAVLGYRYARSGSWNRSTGGGWSG